MRNRFDSQLEKMGQMLTQMGNLCAESIGNVTEALEQGDKEKARYVVEADAEIDQMEKDIEALCLKLLLQQQPVAKDLRQISAALKMITDMERVGDQTADIADIVISSHISNGDEMKNIGKMSEAVAKMVCDSVEAYIEKNLELARNVIRADDEVDEMFTQIKKTLVEKIADQKETHGDIAIDLIMITKYLERIGDHATNIAEWVEFSITGIHVEN